MYTVGQMVVYGIHGVCRITEVQQMRMHKRVVEYFVLEPVDQPGAKYFIPQNNDNALAKLSPVLSKVQLDDLLTKAGTAADVWISDENLRKQKYRELIVSGDRVALLCMIRSLYRHKDEQIAAGRKFHQCDENFLHDAQKILSAEFSLVLGIPTEKIGAYIQEKINAL